MLSDVFSSLFQYETTDKHLSPDGQYVPRIIFVGKIFAHRDSLDSQQRLLLFIGSPTCHTWLIASQPYRLWPSQCLMFTQVTMLFDKVLIKAENGAFMIKLLVDVGANMQQWTHTVSLRFPSLRYLLAADPSMTVRADITGPYSNRMYAYEPGDIKLCESCVPEGCLSVLSVWIMFICRVNAESAFACCFPVLSCVLCSFSYFVKKKKNFQLVGLDL